MSREIAKEILYDNMSDNTAKHINDISFLEDWIIDAMVEYHEKQVKNNDSLHSVVESFECMNTTIDAPKCKEQCSECNLTMG